MARIGKAEHARILHMADVERRKVAEIAAEYGCSPANIYALLGKLRRGPPLAPVQEIVAMPEAAVLPAPPPSPPSPPSPETGVVDLFAAPTKPASPAKVPPPPPPPAPRARPAAARPAAPAKPGYGLVMRSAEGEDSLAPFRSLEDLLGAIKPILRAAATSAEPVWFCIQPVDLATLEDDAA